MRTKAIEIIERLIDAMLASEEFTGNEHVIQKAREFIASIKTINTMTQEFKGFIAKRCAEYSIENGSIESGEHYSRGYYQALKDTRSRNVGDVEVSV